MLGFAKLRVAVLSRAIIGSWHTGMVCTLNLIQKNCSELASQLGTRVAAWMGRAVCVLRGQSGQNACQRPCWRFRAWHILAACPQRSLHAETRGLGGGSQPAKILHAAAARGKQCGCDGLRPCGPMNLSLNFNDFYSQERCNLQCFWAQLFAD